VRDATDKAAARKQLRALTHPALARSGTRCSRQQCARSLVPNSERCGCGRCEDYAKADGRRHSSCRRRQLRQTAPDRAAEAANAVDAPRMTPTTWCRESAASRAASATWKRCARTGPRWSTGDRAQFISSSPASSRMEKARRGLRAPKQRSNGRPLPHGQRPSRSAQTSSWMLSEQMDART
jgi:hypothetical protein